MESVVTNLDKVVAIDLKTFAHARRGNLTVVQSDQDISIYVYDSAQSTFVIGTNTLWL
jgi:hypothetical protein